MVNAIRRIQEFTESLTCESYLESILIQSAVERQLEILGEAAHRLSDEMRQRHPEIEWRKIIGLRNIIIHRHDEIRQQTIWETVVSELDPLLLQLERLLASEPRTVGTVLRIEHLWLTQIGEGFIRPARDVASKF